MGKKKKRGKSNQTQQPQKQENEGEVSVGGITSAVSDLAIAAVSTTPQESNTTLESQKEDPTMTAGKQQQVVRKKEPMQKKEPSQSRSPSTTLVQGAGGSTINSQKRLQPPSTIEQYKTVGKSGRNIVIQANHFEMKIKIPNGIIYHYDIQFQYPWKREVRKSERPFLIKVIERLKMKYKDVFVKPNAVVHDGFKNMYTCFKLNTPSEFEGSVVTATEDENKKEIEIKVKIKYVGSVEVQWAVEQYLRKGTTATKPNDAVQILNIILGMTPQLKFVTLGRNYFNPVKKGDGVIDLDGVKSLWIGTFQSVRLGWKPMLNIDMANKPAYEQTKITDFVNKLLKPRGQQYQAIPEVREMRNGRDRKKVEDELKQLKIKFFRPDGQKRDYRVNKLMEPARDLKMKLDNGQVITIEGYFHSQYGYKLKYPKLPCLHVGDPKRTIYLPMELCELKKQVAPRSKLLNEDEAASMIKKTAISPSVRKQRICDNLKEMNRSFSTDPYAKEFGISVSDQMVEIKGRVLDAPSLKYKKAGEGDEKRDAKFQLPRGGGKWNMGSERDREKFMFHTGIKLSNWGILDVANLRSDEKESFVDALYREACSRGLVIDFPTYETANENNVEDVEDRFKRLYKVLEEYGKPQLIMVLVSRKTNIRSRIKLLGDTIYKIPTQFVMKKNVVGWNAPNIQTMHNICLKLNSKLEGVNQALFVPPKVMEKPVMILGADVTHPSPADTGKKPSIAAVVGSYDRFISKYHCEVRLQYEADGTATKVVEIIKQMEEITKTLLTKFAQANRGNYPLKIIFYRDGVSEGQFVDVLNCEMSAMRRACLSIKQDYRPQITFIVAQKRHKTRLFPKDENKDGFGKMKNVPPGTVVDTVITQPTEYDFFLASHEGIQGTTKPTHYHVLWDDADFSIDDLQSLTYQLCHLYSRCERSVSYPAPTYYAHLAAFRAREHHNALLEKYGSFEKIPKEDIENIQKLKGINFFM